jgi:hypothetical protein
MKSNERRNIPKYATLEDLRILLSETILPEVLTDIILKYNEPIIRVEFNDTKIVYCDQDFFLILIAKK